MYKQISEWWKMKSLMFLETYHDVPASEKEDYKIVEIMEFLFC